MSRSTAPLRSFAVIAIVSAAMLCAPALAAASVKPLATTGTAASVTSSTASLTGSVNPGGAATTYRFDYGTTTLYGASTAITPAGAGSARVAASAAITTLAPATTYHYRIVTHNAHGTVPGADRTFKTKVQPLGLTLAALPNPAVFLKPVILGGVLSGTGSAGHEVVLQSNPFPYTQGFVAFGNPIVTNAQGAFAFTLLSVPVNTQYRVVVPDKPAVVSPIVAVGVSVIVSTRVSTQHVHAGHKVHFFGTVRPARDGAQYAVQRLRGTTWVTVAGSITHHGGGAFSRYGLNVRIHHSGSYRVFVAIADGNFVAATGRTVKISLSKR